jgi:hypothetical protein
MDVLVDPENLEICKKFCGPCPSFKPNQLNEHPSMALFCAQGASETPRDQIATTAATASDAGSSRATGSAEDGSASTAPRGRRNNIPLFNEKLGFSGLLLELAKEPLEVDVLQWLPG